MRRTGRSEPLRGEVGAVPKLKLVRDEAPIEEFPIDLDAAFRRYAPYVARIAARLLGDSALVDDVVQDVFLDAHRGIRRLQSAGALKGWLATITVRKVRRRLRRAKALRFIGLERVADRGGLVAAGSPEDAAALGAVYRVLEEMPVDDRIAWILRHVEGHNLEAVAARVGCSRATAHRRVARAAAHLREVFDA